MGKSQGGHGCISWDYLREAAKLATGPMLRLALRTIQNSRTIPDMSNVAHHHFAYVAMDIGDIYLFVLLT
jgi:hypothetical protein